MDRAASFIYMMQLLFPSIHPAASGSCAVFSPPLFCFQQPNTLCTGTRPHPGVTEAVTQMKKKQTYILFYTLWLLEPLTCLTKQGAVSYLSLPTCVDRIQVTWFTAAVSWSCFFLAVQGLQCRQQAAGPVFYPNLQVQELSPVGKK